MHVLKFIFILLEVLLLFNLLILAHELGHFLAARWRGMVADRFGIWFGKPIWSKKINGVTYCLGSIPAGGYVSLPQMASMEAIEGKVEGDAESYPPVSALDKMIVAFAGPLFSFLMALFFAFLVWGIGRPISETETTLTIGHVIKGSPSEAAGLRAGDQIVSVDGVAVTRWAGIGDTVQWRVVSSKEETIPIVVMRDGKTTNFVVTPHKDETKVYERKALREIQILPKETAIIAKVVENSPAALGGLKPNDIVVAANGRILLSPAMLPDILKENAGQAVELTIKRDKKESKVSVKPAIPEIVVSGSKTNETKEEVSPMLGIMWEHGGLLSPDHPNPIVQIKASVNAMVGTLGAVLSPKSDIKFQHLSGPVGIIRIYYRLFESEQGWRLAIWFSVVLNINLAILNLLPIPVLDGGHIVVAIIEGIRRKPIHVRVLSFLQNACAMLLIGYMLYVTFFDAQDLPWKRQKATEIRFKPPAAAPAQP